MNMKYVENILVLHSSLCRAEGFSLDRVNAEGDSPYDKSTVHRMIKNSCSWLSWRTKTKPKIQCLFRRRTMRYWNIVNISANTCINALSSDTLKKISQNCTKFTENPKRKCSRSFESFKVTKNFTIFVVFSTRKQLDCIVLRRISSEVRGEKGQAVLLHGAPGSEQLVSPTPPPTHPHPFFLWGGGGARSCSYTHLPCN